MAPQWLLADGDQWRQYTAKGPSDQASSVIAPRRSTGTKNAPKKGLTNMVLDV
jgi:hypothetical protein